MGTALEGAPRFCVRGRFSFARATPSFNPGGRRQRRLAGTGIARMGVGARAKKRRTRDFGPLRLHAQPSLSWQLRNRPGIHDCGGKMDSRRSLPSAFHLHLYTGHAD